MKKLLYFLLMLCSLQSLAQQYYHAQYPLPAGATPYSTTSLVPMADGNFCFATTHFDSLFSIVQLNAATSAVTQARTFVGTGSNPLPDTVVYYYYPRFFATRDSGMAVVFSQSNYNFPPQPTDSG